MILILCFVGQVANLPEMTNRGGEPATHHYHAASVRRKAHESIPHRRLNQSSPTSTADFRKKPRVRGRETSSADFGRSW
jgi:hypothetical protein